MQYFTINYLFALIVVGAANPHYIPFSTIEHFPSPGYSFNYAVNDPSTGDNKGQWEVRHGDNVKGSYSLVEPDGTLRVVDYHADDLTGFNAVVKRVGPAMHPTAIHPTAMPLAPIAIPIAHLEPKPLQRPFIHPLTFSPLPAPYTRMPEPIPKPMVPFTTFPHPSMRNIGTFAKPIIVADPIIPIRAFDPFVPLVPLVMPHERPTYGPTPFTISGATYGKHGIVKSWSSGPIDLEGKSLFIRHRH